MTELATLFAAALAHHQEGRPDAAAPLYRAVLDAAPDHPDSLHLLGVALHQLGQPEEAVRLIGQAIALTATEPAYHHNLGEVLRALGRPGEAVPCLERAVALAPDWAEAHEHLGAALHELGRFDEAVACTRHALALAPSAAACSNLGMTLQELGDLAGSEASLRQALLLEPGHAEAANNLGHVLKEQGRVAEAVACYRKQVAAAPEDAQLRSNLLFTVMALPGTTLADAAGLAREWDRHHGASTKAKRRAVRPSAGTRAPRLGFVSGDFRCHAVGFLVIATLEALARAGHGFACYSNSPIEDALTARFKMAAKWWRPIVGLSDEAAAAQIRADGIDVLFDLSGHTAGNRLLLFARKPAPVQIHWAGYVATTGLTAMDYLLADAHQAPEAAQPWYGEQIIRMPASYVCWEPPAPELAPPVTDLPALRQGFVTFGAFNFLSKVSPDAVALWSRVLQRLPSARLVVKAAGLQCGAVRARMEAAFAGQGVAPERVLLEGITPRPAHLARIGSVDLALDPVPYTGGITTLETLWMGVPVLTWPGETFCSRHSHGYLTTLGLAGAEGTVACDGADFVDRAVAWATDLPRLAATRAGLRHRILASPLCDAPAFAASFAKACQIVWQRHCAGEQPQPLNMVEG